MPAQGENSDPRHADVPPLAAHMPLFRRLLPHLVFCLGLAGTLLLTRFLPAQPDARIAFTPTPSATSAASLAEMMHQGVGGSEPSYLLAHAVPHTSIPRRYRIDPITYTVQPGDNPWSIAESFGVSEATVLWANGNLEDNPDYLAVGDVLTILPVSGVYHEVVEGDTLASIAKYYKVTVEDITTYEGNYMSEPYSIVVGQKLIVPGGSKPYRPRRVRAWTGDIPTDAKRGTGVFGWPLSGVITQRYYDYHQAVDIGAPKGTSINAADSGYVAVVGRSDTGYGLYVVIDHGNGFQTLYAHFSMVVVDVGQSVAKGQTIGLCGSTGKSTGPHLHLELYDHGVRRNPLIFLR